MGFDVGLWPDPETMRLLVIAIGLFTICVHIALAIGVYQDAFGLIQTNAGPLWLVQPLVWAFVVVLGGVIAAAIYWAMHHSVLNPHHPRSLEPGQSV